MCSNGHIGLLHVTLCEMGLIKSRCQSVSGFTISVQYCLSKSVCTCRGEYIHTSAGCFSAELPQLAALPHTVPVTHLCLIRGSLQENIVEPALVDSEDPTTSPSFIHSLTHSIIHFLTHVALPRHPTQSPLPALPTAYYNLHGRALSRLPSSDNVCIGETARLAEQVKGNEIAIWAGAALYLNHIK